MNKLLLLSSFLLLVSCSKEHIVGSLEREHFSGRTQAIVASAFYVSPLGNDSNEGTFTSPFKTFERARNAMRLSSSKTTYLRSGTYVRDSTLFLTSADNGQTWSTYPEDAINSALITGLYTPTDTLKDVIDIIGGNNITINGLTIQNFTYRGIAIHGGKGFNSGMPYFTIDHPSALSNTIINNIVENGITPGNGWDKAAIYAKGTVTNTIISHNVVRNCSGYGIGVWSLHTGDNTTGSKITDNVLLNVCGTAVDGGAIYIIDRLRFNTGIVIKNNFIRDYGVSTNNTRGIYFDDLSSNLTVQGNIISGTGTQPIMYHSGRNNKVTGNIIDLNDNSSKNVIIYQNDGNAGIDSMDANTFTGNVILSNYTNVPVVAAYRKVITTGVMVTNPLIKDNLYYNYSTGVVNTNGGNFADLFPLTGNPKISDWTYTINSSSMVFSSPINFTPILGNWGPTGYIIPNIGTPPSCLLTGLNAVYRHAESYDEMSGISRATFQIGSCDNNDWVSYTNVDLGSGLNTFTARVAVAPAQAGKTVEVRSGSITGQLLGTLTVANTGSFTSFLEQSTTLTGASGVHNIYIVFKGGYGIGNFDYFKFH